MNSHFTDSPSLAVVMQDVIEASGVTIVDNTKPPPPQVMAREDELRAKYEGKRVIRTEDIAGYWLCCCCPVPCGIVHKEAIGPHQMRWRHRGCSPGVPCFCGRKLDYVVERTGGNDFGDDKTFAKTYATPFWIEDCLECWCKLGICRCRGTNCECCEALCCCCVCLMEAPGSGTTNGPWGRGGHGGTG